MQNVHKSFVPILEENGLIELGAGNRNKVSAWKKE